MPDKNIEDITKKELYLFKNVTLMDKYNFYEYLSIMLDGGVTITAALEGSLDKIKNVYFKEKISELLVFISSGDNLSKSMKKIPDVFSNSETSILEAGEKSGTLVDSLISLSEEFKKLHNLKSKIKGALTYPAIIMIFLVLAVMIVMTYVIPSIIPLIDEAGVEKPFATLALIATSDFVKNNFFGIIIFLIAIFGGLYVYKSTENGKKVTDKIMLGLPLIGRVYKNYILASSVSVLGNLLNSGVGIVKTFQLVGKSTNNVIYEELYSKISLRVGSGKKIVESIQEVDPTNEYFPLDFIQLLSVGEKTASIGKVSKKLNDQYTREVNYSLNNLTKWIEPIAILVAGIFVLWFAFAIFGSILKLTDTIG